LLQNGLLFFSRTSHKSQCIAVATDLFFGEVIKKNKPCFGTSYFFLITKRPSLHKIMSFFLLSIIVGILFLVPMGTRIYFLNPQSPMHRSVALCAFLVGIVGIIEYQIGHTETVATVEKLAIYHSSSALVLTYIVCLGAYYYVATYSESWRKWGFYLLLVLAIPPLFVIYNLFFKGAVLDVNHQLIDGKWRYTVLEDGLVPTAFGVSFLLLQIYLSVSHFIGYRKARYKEEKFWKLLLLLVFTAIPAYVSYTFLYAVNEGKLGDYGITPFLAILIFVVSWIYTNFKLFEINPIVAIDNILESMSNIIIITDTNFRIKYVNKSFEHLGAIRKMYIDKSLVQLAEKFGKIPQERFEIIRNLEKNKKHERTIQFQFSKTFHLLMTVSATYNQQNNRIGYVFALTDLTEDVDNRNKLKDYTQQLEQSNKELESFAYIASHDMKTPLRNIVSFLNLIERKLKNYEDKDVHEFIGFVTSNARYMHGLVQDILEFSKISNTEESFIEVDLQEVILNILTHLSGYIKEKNAVIQFEKLPTIKANKPQIQQLFQNLIENGIKYNESETPMVNIYAAQNNTSLSITFEDNGIGISETYHDQIFGMFKRLHNSTTYQGTGIGLAICKKIMEVHHGKISVTSAENQGSRFSIEFPKD
jgi:PAS domain S-box-containing protein